MNLCWQSNVSAFSYAVPRLVITFLPISKRLLISWLQSPSAVILEPPPKKSDTVSTVSPSIPHEVMGPDAMILVFWMLSFKPTFSFFTFTFIKRLFNSSSLSAIRAVSSVYLRLFIFLPAVLIPATVRTGHGTTDWFQIGKRGGLYCHSNLIIFQSPNPFRTRLEPFFLIHLSPHHQMAIVYTCVRSHILKNLSEI